MDCLLVFMLIFLSSLSSALTQGTQCSPVSINVTAGAANVVFQNLPDTNDANATMQFLASSFDASRGQFDRRYINTTVAIQALHCRPQVQSQNSTKLQLLVHGITYDKSMWSGFGYSPRYNWHAYATSLGYHTLAVDRLGHGSRTPHPDPFAVVQGLLQVDVLHKLIGMLRQGWLQSGGFNEIIYVGHSYGSSLGNMLAKEHPLDTDALILTGFSGALSTTSSTLSSYRSATEVSNKFKGISAGYLTVMNESERSAAFYGGSFDQHLAALDFDREDTVTVGELLSPGLKPVRTGYLGDVLVMTGDKDVLFCPGGPATCADALRGTEILFQNSSYSYAVIPNTGHCLTLHKSAPLVMEVAHNWLRKRQ